MRDRNRIVGVMADLMAVWEKVPDLRLGQFVMGLTDSDTELFYLEDDKLVERAKSFVTAGFTQGRLL